MKKLFFMALFCVFLSAALSAQTSQVVYIRIQETSGFGPDPIMVVVKPDNSYEEVKLKRLTQSAKSVAENGILIKTEISKWLDQGFKILSVNGDSYRTDIFMKRE